MSRTFSWVTPGKALSGGAGPDAAAKRAALSTTRDFATLVIVGQTQEIAEMRAVVARPAR